MTQSCCPHCRLRFTSAAAPHLASCPECDRTPEWRDADDVIGFRLYLEPRHDWPDSPVLRLPWHGTELR